MLLARDLSPEHGCFVRINLCLSVSICGQSFLPLCIEVTDGVGEAPAGAADGI